MKKFLSITLAVIMMFSISVIAFAADGSAIVLGKEYTVTLDNDTANYTFTAPEDGAYLISASVDAKNTEYGLASVTVGNDDSYFATLNLFFFNESEPDSLAEFSNVEDYDVFMAAKDTELTVSVECGLSVFDIEDMEYPPLTITFKITKVDDLREIKMGESYTVNGQEYFVLRPTEDAVYDFWSYDCTTISIMDLDGNIYGDARYDDFPVDVVLEAKAGKIYGICVESDTDEEGNYIDSVFHVVDSATIKPDIIELEDITVFWHDAEAFYPIVYPIGANCKSSDLEVEVADEKIATVEYDADNDIFWVYGHRLGKTELTVTEKESGIARTVEVKVTTRFAEFFHNIFEFILDIIDTIATR